MGLLTKGIRAIQKGRVQKKLKKAEEKRIGDLPKRSRFPHIREEQAAKRKHAAQQAKIQEAQKGAKKAERGSKTKQVEKRVLPDVSKRLISGTYVPKGRGPGLHIRTQLKGLSAKDIAEKYTGKEIIAMIRKVKNPQVLAKLQKAQRSREKRQTKFIEGRQGPEYPKKVIQSVDYSKPKGQRVKTTTIPKSGTRAAKLKAKTWKTGGTVKRKSGGKMNTDGNLYVASLYKGGKVGG